MLLVSLKGQTPTTSASISINDASNILEPGFRWVCLNGRIGIISLSLTRMCPSSQGTPKGKIDLQDLTHGDMDKVCAPNRGDSKINTEPLTPNAGFLLTGAEP